MPQTNPHHVPRSESSAAGGVPAAWSLLLMAASVALLACDVYDASLMSGSRSARSVYVPGGSGGAAGTGSTSGVSFLTAGAGASAAGASGASAAAAGASGAALGAAGAAAVSGSGGAPAGSGAAGTAAPAAAGSGGSVAGGAAAGKAGGSAAGAGGAPACPSLASCDDGNACTLDAVSGGTSCACTHVAITALTSGDGCCPSGADAVRDSDCPARCGNGVREGGEECDGTTGCNGSCRLTLSASQIACIDAVDGDACAGCECMECPDELNACRASGNTKRDQACDVVETCAAAAGCAGEACYCGTSNLASCGFFANGPCKSQIEAAAGTRLALNIQAQYNDPNSALGRARTLGLCRREHCASECR